MTGTDTQAIADRIESYIRERFRVTAADTGFSQGTDLWDGYVDSLGTVELLTFVETTFDVVLPANALFSEERKSVAGLAAMVAELAGSALSASLGASVLPTLRHGDPSKTPFVLVHGADGHPYNYMRLVRRMDPSRPVHALVSPSLEPAAPFRTTPELLAEYRDALLRECPTGPIVLGGWSYGGILAYDLARQLTEAGREVRTLVIFDTTPPLGPWSGRLALSLTLTERLIYSVRPSTDRDELLRLARAVLRRDPDGLRNLEKSPPGDFGPLEQLARRIEAVEGEVFRQTFLPGQSAQSLHRAALVFGDNLRDAQVPRDKWSFPGEMVLFACEGHEAVRQWQGFASRPLTVHEYAIQGIAGKTPHASLMEDSNIDLFAPDLSRTLES